MTAPSWVTRLVDSPSSPWLSRARPMSRILTTPPGASSRFCGLTSRWTRPRSEACCKPQRRLPAIVAGPVEGQRAVRLDQAGEVDPFDVFHDEEVGAADLVGVDGPDDVGVVELRGGADLALEAADGVGVLQALLADDLDGDDAAELPVAGLEDGAHAALAEALQQDVGAEQQARALALEELVGLVRRQPPPTDQLAGQGARLGKGGLQPDGLVKPARLQQPAPAEGVHQTGGGVERHGNHPARSRWVGGSMMAGIVTRGEGEDERSVADAGAPDKDVIVDSYSMNL